MCEVLMLHGSHGTKPAARDHSQGEAPCIATQKKVCLGCATRLIESEKCLRMRLQSSAPWRALLDSLNRRGRLFHAAHPVSEVLQASKARLQQAPGAIAAAKAREPVAATPGPADTAAAAAGSKAARQTTRQTALSAPLRPGVAWHRMCTLNARLVQAVHCSSHTAAVQ